MQKLWNAKLLFLSAVPAMLGVGAHNAVPAAATVEEMTFVGDLRKIGTNNLAGVVTLKTLTSRPHTYGLGMVAGLSSELLIFDSEVFLGSFDGNRYSIDTKRESLVAFGGFVVVNQWQAEAIPETVKTFKDLESFIGVAAKEHGWSAEKPMPFKLEAKADGLRWFVVNGMGNLKPSPRESFVRNLYKGGIDDAKFEAFGFFSNEHRGIYTNPVSSIHVHFRLTDGPPFVGHIDDELLLNRGAVLFLPKS